MQLQLSPEFQASLMHKVRAVQQQRQNQKRDALEREQHETKQQVASLSAAHQGEQTAQVTAIFALPIPCKWRVLWSHKTLQVHYDASCRRWLLLHPGVIYLTVAQLDRLSLTANLGHTRIQLQN